MCVCALQQNATFVLCDRVRAHMHACMSNNKHIAHNIRIKIIIIQDYKQFTVFILTLLSQVKQCKIVPTYKQKKFVCIFFFSTCSHTSEKSMNELSEWICSILQKFSRIIYVILVFLYLQYFYAYFTHVIWKWSLFFWSIRSKSNDRIITGFSKKKVKNLCKCPWTMYI